MKKLLWILGGLFIALLVAVVSIPLFVDVDQYRPTIVAEANKRLNGKLELGHLKLSLWGTIKVHADSIRLSVNGFSEPLLDTQQFHLEVPVLSILTGAPQVVAVLEQPKINVIKEKNGKMNAMELMNTGTAEAAPAPAAPATPPAATVPPPAQKPVPVAGNNPPPAAAPAAPAEPAKVPAIVAGARLGLRIEGGNLNYLDKLTQSSYQVIGLDLDARNLGLGSNMTVHLKAPVKGASPTMSFEGPLTADAELKPNLEGSVVKSVSGKVDFDATKLKVEMKGGLFHKTDSMPLQLHAQFDGSNQETLLRALDLQFADIKVHGKGRLTTEPLTAKLEIGSDPGSVRFDKLHEFVPMVEPYQLKGQADFNANVDWKPEALKAAGDLKVADGSFFMKDVLKAPMQFRVQAGFSESSLNIARAALAGPDTEIELVGNVKNFLAPQFSAAITGKSFNVDKTLVLPPPGAAKSASNGFALIPSAYAEAKPNPDVNPMLELAKNPIVAKAAGLVTAQIGRITVYNAVLEQVSARVQLQNMVLKILEASLKTFGGGVKTTGDFDLKAPALSYRSQGSVAGVQAKEAFKTYFPKYQNTLEGVVDANWNLGGALYPPTARMRSLKGTAKLAAHDGALKSVDIQDSLNSAMSKVPFLKNQKPVKVDNGFKSLTADVKFDRGVIRAEPIEVQPRNEGFVIKGKSTIQESLEQETFLDVYDPQGQLPKELRNPGKPAIALRIYGPITGPKTDYGYTVQKLAGTAGRNIVKEQGLNALQKVLGVESKPGASDSDKVKDAADKLKKAFHL